MTRDEQVTNAAIQRIPRELARIAEALTPAEVPKDEQARQIVTAMFDAGLTRDEVVEHFTILAAIEDERRQARWVKNQWLTCRFRRS